MIGKHEHNWESLANVPVSFNPSEWNVLRVDFNGADFTVVFINAAWWRGDKDDLMEYVFHELDGKSELWDYHPWTDEVNEAKAVENDLNNIKRLFNKWNPESTMHIAILEENGNTHSLHRLPMKLSSDRCHNIN